MSRKIEDLIPDLQVKCHAFLSDARSAVSSMGLDILITQTYRTPEEQAAIYAMGRTAAGRIVTYAPPGYSWHEFGRAFDICFLKGRRAIWEGPWDLMGDIGEANGLEWGGRWKRPDRPHFQYTGYTLAQARADGYTPGIT